MKAKWLVYIFLFMLIVAGCQNREVNIALTSYLENYEIIGSEKEEIVANISETIYATSDRSNTNAEEVSIPLVERSGIEIQVPEGRYELTGYETGNFYIFDEDGQLLYREIIKGWYGVESITLDILETHTIFADGGFDSVVIRPVPTEKSNQLSAGIWEVGLDIDEGEYNVSTPYGLGYLQIFSENEEPKVYELLTGQYFVNEIFVQLKEGQKLKIIGTSVVNFEPISNN